MGSAVQGKRLLSFLEEHLCYDSSSVSRGKWFLAGEENWETEEMGEATVFWGAFTENGVN